MQVPVNVVIGRVSSSMEEGCKAQEYCTYVYVAQTPDLSTATHTYLTPRHAHGPRGLAFVPSVSVRTLITGAAGLGLGRRMVDMGPGFENVRLEEAKRKLQKRPGAHGRWRWSH